MALRFYIMNLTYGFDHDYRAHVHAVNNVDILNDARRFKAILSEIAYNIIQ